MTEEGKEMGQRKERPQGGGMSAAGNESRD
jgi:hypothetical protein